MIRLPNRSTRQTKPGRDDRRRFIIQDQGRPAKTFPAPKLVPDIHARAETPAVKTHGPAADPRRRRILRPRFDLGEDAACPSGPRLLPCRFTTSTGLLSSA